MAMRVLIVEDDRSASRMLAFELEKAGFEIELAFDGVEGLRKAQQSDIRIVLLDAMLPGLDGFEVCDRLRKSNSNANVPVVMISGKSGEVDHLISKKVGANSYIVKPAPPETILAEIERIIKLTENSRRPLLPLT